MIKKKAVILGKEKKEFIGETLQKGNNKDRKQIFDCYKMNKMMNSK